MASVIAGMPSASVADPWKDESGKSRVRVQEWDQDRREAIREWEKDRREAVREWQKDQREAAREWPQRGGQRWRRDEGRWYASRPEYYGDYYATDYRQLPPPSRNRLPASRFDDGPPRYESPYGPRYYEDDLFYDDEYNWHRHGPPDRRDYGRFRTYRREPYYYDPYDDYEPRYWSHGSEVGARIGSRIGGAIGGPEGAAIGGDIGAEIGAEVDD